MIHYILRALFFLGLGHSSIVREQLLHDRTISKFLESKTGNPQDVEENTRWALLVAGSRDYENYRHQVQDRTISKFLLVAGSRDYENYRHQVQDRTISKFLESKTGNPQDVEEGIVCHAFQILKKGGLKEENIIVFMYDDIASDADNPRPGVIVNSPNGENIYEGVPKDYTRKDVNVQNLFAVILGNKSALTGESGKVVDSGPKDHIFIYYTDHGGPGLVANATEDSFATYCPDDFPYISQTYDVCLGDVYSFSWIEDSEKHDLRSETLGQQLHVKEDSNRKCRRQFPRYGIRELSSQRGVLDTFMGSNSLNNNYTRNKHSLNNPSAVKAVNQREADLLHYQEKLRRTPKDSTKWHKARKQLLDKITSRRLVDHKMKQISRLLFGAKRINVLHTVRLGGQPLVDDWSCLKTFVKIYEEHCGPLTRYGMKYTRGIANMCNEKISAEQMKTAAAKICK
ncbi:Vacuolar-processing enzyme alpha-isozyme [Striga hermonthica]|uniref:Vacuolar-processing enzyme alpha-isozyme n=1 Tax=Striga hermonthica TaxID=68872 RepID=A0A9N7NIK5_STRHE|nr:Vacuolar-processing enzyme alpha-isozyme [Striga hermonthica]